MKFGISLSCPALLVAADFFVHEIHSPLRVARDPLHVPRLDLACCHARDLMEAVAVLDLADVPAPVVRQRAVAREDSGWNASKSFTLASVCAPEHVQGCKWTGRLLLGMHRMQNDLIDS